MDNGSRKLGWAGLIIGGVLSIGANVRSIHLPDMPAVDFGSYVVAVAPVALAMLGIEQVARWRHLPNALRYGVVGLASLIAVAASWTHIVSVMKFYGQAPVIAYSFPLAVDGIMLLSSLSLFVPFPDKRTPDSADTYEPVHMDTPDADNGVDSLPADTDTVATALDADTDNFVPDAWTPDSVDTPDEPAPVDVVDRVPTPRRSRGASAPWKARALELIAEGTCTDMAVARTILAEFPGTWPTPEAGRKAVSRLR